MKQTFYAKYTFSVSLTVLEKSKNRYIMYTFPNLCIQQFMMVFQTYAKIIQRITVVFQTHAKIIQQTAMVFWTHAEIAEVTYSPK
jgi:hypothetical protein